MLRSCVCIRSSSNDSKRRSSSIEDASSCRSSEIERVGASMQTTTLGPSGQQSVAASRASSLLQLFQKKGWCKQFRKPLRGMSASKAERTIKSAILIQRWYRKHRSRMEMQKRCNWQIFQNLEYASEQDQAELYKFFNELLQYMPTAAGAKTDIHGSRSSLVSILKEADNFKPEHGDVINKKFELPLKKSDIDELIDIFRKKRGNRLSPKSVGFILREAAKTLHQLPNLMSVSTAVSQQMTVCGDLHGKLDDLLVILYKNGLPSTSNPYIFNGDFVDRGKKSLEVLLLLLSLFLAFPNSVFLNRGNHEDAVMNVRYGFTREVESKYPVNFKQILKLIDEVFRWLPLGSIINNRVLIVHGGFSDTTNLDLIKSMDRGRYVSILRPPVGVSTDPIDKTEWQQLFDIMWSDPQTTFGCKPNNLRGAGVYWGPDITDNFLKRNRLSYVIRSHECKPDGHEFMHDNKVITIFSASNYYAIGSNRGAYLKLDQQLQPKFVLYISGTSQTKRLSFKQRMGIAEYSALKELAVRLREHEDDLETEFRKYDPDGEGMISITQWCEAMEKVTKLGLPWRHLREKLAPSTDGQNVDYRITLDLLNTDIIMEAEADGTTVIDSLYSNKSNLEAIFNIIDSDNSGEITLDEFEKAIDLMQRRVTGTQSKEEMMEKCRMMDLNHDGKVDLNEFLEAFRLSQLSRKQQQEEEQRRRSTRRGLQETSESVHKIAKAMSRNMISHDGDIDPTDCVSTVIKGT